MDNNFGSAPLTLEELKKMDDQAVRVKNLEYEEGGVHTGVVTTGDPNDSDNGADMGCVFFPILEYGKTWLAYPYRPAHIEREKWKACKECVSCENCQNNEDFDPYEGSYGECGQCCDNSKFKPKNFCYDCGRPLTEEAWAELEKRVRG